jgi:hypothetical protein
MWSKLILLLFISSCTVIFDKDKKEDIIIEEIEPIQNTKVDCDTKSLTQLELTKCKMETRLLELKY